MLRELKNTETARSRSAGLSSILTQTQGFMRRQLWIWPLLAAVLLAFVAIWVRGRMEAAIKAQISGNLKTILAANAEALRAWVATMKSQAEVFAGDDRLRQWTAELAAIAQQSESPQAALLSAPQNTALRAHLKPVAEGRGFNGYVVLDTNYMVIASGREQIIGFKSPPGYAPEFERALQGAPFVTHPFPSVAMLPDAQGKVRAGVPTMFAVSPIRAADGRIIAMLGLRIAPDKDFTRILATARSGETGETYAFDRKGLMLSQSRFDDQLKQLALIPDSTDAQSILTLELRDPQVDLSKGKASSTRRAELPFTRAITEAIAGRDGLDVNGYRDYRGVPVVGAWTWLPDLNLGLVTEMDVSEAFGPLWSVRIGFGFIFGLLLLGAIAIFVLMRLANRLQESARKAASKAKQLGQYALEDKIGAGAFGTVYRGRHALMRRPVAVKLLDTSQASENSIARFEREVQLTCQLTHPNTIALYDYGRTPEGLFYYAMEFLDGLSLNELVNRYGRLPEARVIHILRQVCASLAEAHEMGLIHRDIKPHNIFLTRRGNIPDFVKVLDFGLVKARNVDGQAELTGGNATIGTPLYMSPEAVERPNAVDAKTDLYSVGAVGFFLLTGETVFFGGTVGEVMMQQVKSEPERPSARLSEAISSDFEDLLMSCLAKKPAARPASARELESALGRCAHANGWSHDDAENWWRRFDAVRAEATVVMKREEQPAPA
jgi:eukaryotic-like serine/threonine-protein kinase